MPSEQLDNELEALLSIFPESISIISKSPSDGLTTVHYSCRHDLTIVFKLKDSYPLTSSPTFSLKFHEHRNEASRFDHEIQSIIDANVGSEVLFQVIQKVNDLVNNDSDNVNGVLKSNNILNENDDDDDDEEIYDDEDVNKNPYIKYTPQTAMLSSGSQNCTNHLTIIHGEIIKEKKSSFQSHLCFVQSMEDVYLFRQIVLNDKRIASATHNIFVYRFTKEEINNNNNNNIISYHDFDDDGETAAGSRLAEMIRLLKVDGIAMIVSRWFGGIKLGPDRFKFICNSARTLLESHGFGKS